MDNAAITRTFYENWNRREFEKNDQYVAEDCEIVLVGSGTTLRGPEGERQLNEMWAEAFPDGKVTVVEITGRGTHTGTLRSPGGDIPASGRSVTLQLCDVLEFRDGKVRSVHTYMDSASLLMQVGAMPEIGARATA
jgi:steroid delta-isomerase-like uncharacterized protein